MSAPQMDTMRPDPASPSSAILESIVDSCEKLRAKSNILIDASAISQFLSNLDEADWNKEVKAGSEGIRLPLKFETNEEELNVISTLSILNFLSGYRAPLHRLTSRGAYTTILLLLLSAHLSPSSTSPLTTSGMIACTTNSLAALIQLSLTKEVPHPVHGRAILLSERDTEAIEIVSLLAGVLHETGKILKDLDFKNLGEWMKDALIETKGDAAKMLEKLVSTFPAFNDAYFIDDEPVYIYKKALFLLTSISQRFSPSLDGTAPEGDRAEQGAVTFPVPTLSELELFPIFADNVIPTLLVHLSILDLSKSTDPSLYAVSTSATAPTLPPSAVESSENVTPASKEFATPSLPISKKQLSEISATKLRAASICACKLIVQIVNTSYEIRGEGLGGITEVELDNYLWNLGKKEIYKDIERFSESGTVFY